MTTSASLESAPVSNLSIGIDLAASGRLVAGAFCVLALGALVASEDLDGLK